MQVINHCKGLPASFENMNYGVVVHRNFTILDADEGYLKYLGFTCREELQKLTSLLDLIHPSDHQQAQENYRKLMTGELAPSVQIFQNLTANHDLNTVMTLEHIIDFDGEKALQVTVIDISEHVENQKRLLETEERYKELVEGSLQAMLVHDNFKPVFCNQAYAELIGLNSIDEVFQLDSILSLIPIEDQENAIQEYTDLIEGKIESTKYDARGYNSSGDTIWVDVFGKRIRWDGKAVVQVSFMDITEQHLLREQIRFRATYDGLTKVLNRTSISEQAENLIKLSNASKTSLACLLLDIDDFKWINDTYGHGCGDKVLVEFTQFCQKSLRGSDLFGRWGGEEFLIILPDTTADNAMRLANRIRENTANLVINIKGHKEPIHFTVSMGLALLCPNEKNLQSLVSKADKGLYVAKGSGKNQVIYHSD